MHQLSPLIELVHHRWSVPALALLQQQRGAKFITMVNMLGVSRDSLRRTLRALIAAELVVNNPGYGHPMRPEYVLTPRGQQIGSLALPLANALRKRSVTVYKKWSLPTIAALAAMPRSFNALKRELGAASPRAVSLTLKDLEADGLVHRHVEETHPPTVSYQLSRSGKRLAPLVIDLAEAL